MELQPAEKRRLQQRQDARRTILDATEALLVEEGYDRFSMRKLAQRCGYTAPSIYHHFGDKAGLIDALLEERFRGLLELLRRVRLVDDPRANIRQLALAFVRFGMENPTHYRLLYTPRPLASAPVPSAEAALELFERPFRQLSREGHLVTDDLQAATQACWVMLHGLIHLRTARPDLDWSERLLDVALDAMVRGVLRNGSDEEAR
jgi:AcrR family transcriptional regulator